MYDGHSRTFFFADYTGLNEKRGQVFVNTVPTAETRNGDFSNFRDASGNLITYLRSTDDQDEPGVQPSAAGECQQPAVPARSVPGQHDSGQSHQPRRTQRRQHLSAAERAGQFQQLHVHRRSRVDGPGVLRAASITGFPTTVQCSSGSTTATSRSTRHRDRPPAVCQRLLTPRRDSTSGPFVAGIQNTRLTTHGAAFNYSRASVATPRQRNARRLCTHGAVDVPVGLWHAGSRIARHPRHQRHRVHDRSAEHQRAGHDRHLRPDRRFCRSTRRNSTGRSRTRWCG